MERKEPWRQRDPGGSQKKGRCGHRPEQHQTSSDRIPEQATRQSVTDPLSEKSQQGKKPKNS